MLARRLPRIKPSACMACFLITLTLKITTETLLVIKGRPEQCYTYLVFKKNNSG